MLRRRNVGAVNIRRGAAGARPGRERPARLRTAVGKGAARRYELLATDAEAKATTRLTRRLFPDMHATVSPDGETVAFTRADSPRLDAPHDIFLVPVEGGEPRRLERTPRDERAPRFSGDGRWLAFTYSTSHESDRVGIVEVESPASRDVIADVGDQYGGTWEPGSHRVAYSHGSFLNGNYALYVTDADTAEVTRIAGSDLYGSDGAAWTQGGELFTVARDESKRPDEESIWLLGKDGSDARVVATTRGRLHYGLAFAPDDSAVALGLDFKGVSGRVVVAGLGDEPVELTAEMGVPGGSPMWSPDGTTIAFLRGSGVWLMDADGRNVRRVAGSRGAERLVAWLAEPAG